MVNNSLEQLSLHTIGGGWGTENADATNNVRVSVIRGTDIPRLKVGDTSTVPIRYESAAKVKNRLLKHGDIVIEVSGGSAASGQHTGRALLVTEKMIESLGGKVIPASFCRLLRLDTGKVNPHFIVFQIDSLHITGEISEFENQSTGISNFQFTRFIQEIFPSVEDSQFQAAIAHILGSLDDKIELNRKRNETLEAMARALFQDWFVDFGPVRAKLEGRDPYLPAEIWELFPERLDEDGKPEGWGEKPLDEIADFLNGLALQKFPAKDVEDSLPVIKIAELRNGVSAKSDRASREVPTKYIIEDGDFLFSWSGSLVAKFWTEGEGALNQHLFKVTSKTYPMWFVSQWVHHHLEEFQAIAAAKATTMGHIQRGHLSAAMTICPNIELMSTMSRIIAPIVGQTVENELESRSLAQLRDTLLPKLISGELRVADAEKFLERAAL